MAARSYRYVAGQDGEFFSGNRSAVCNARQSREMLKWATCALVHALVCNDACGLSFLKTPSRWKWAGRVESWRTHAPPTAASICGTKASWHARRPIREARVYFDLGWPTQPISFKSSSRAAIAMVQTADLRYGDHLSFRWMLDSTWHRCVTFQREMSA